MIYNNVLLIDDDPFTAQIHQLILQWSKLDKYLKVVNEGQKALEILNNLEQRNCSLPRYILLDLNMPDMDGFEFMEKYEQCFAHKNNDTNIIIITSSIREIDKQKSMNFTFVTDYKVKPLPENFVENLITQ